VTSHQLEQTLRDLPAIGTLVKDRGYRQVWRFEFAGKPYYLKFYPRAGSRLKRLIRGNPAIREFTRLQWLQKAAIPAPRAVAHLVGFRLREQVGDAVILEGIEPSLQLDNYLNDLLLEGQTVPGHLQLSQQIRQLVHHLGRAKLGHADLHLGNLLLHEKKVYLLDGYAVRPGGLKLDDVLLLGLTVARFATRTDLQRGWELLGPGGRLPSSNPVARRQWRKFLQRSTEENAYFGRVVIDGWQGQFYKSHKYPRRWSRASRLKISADDWRREIPELLGRIESDQLEVLKRGKSGDVLAGQIILGGHPIEVVIKRPRRRYWYRFINEIGRGSRSRRAWLKAWRLIVRDLPTGWPLAYFEKRVMGYVTESFILFERIPGQTLAEFDLSTLAAPSRNMLLRRCARILRKIDDFRLSHFDPKTSNWIVLQDDVHGPTPILIDVDGVRSYPWRGFGLRRLFRSLKEHPQYLPSDAQALGIITP